MTWPMVALGDVCDFRYGKSLPASIRDGGEFPVFGSNGVVGQHSVSLVDGPVIVVGRKGSFGEVAYSEGPCWPIDTTYFIDRNATEADPRWLYYLLGSLGLTKLNRAAAIPGLNREDAYRLRVAIPPLDEQRRIAAILDQADAIRAKRILVIESLDGLPGKIFNDMFKDASTPSVTLGALCSFKSGGTPSKQDAEAWAGDTPWFTPKDFKSPELWDSKDHVADPGAPSRKMLPAGTVCVVVRGMILAHTFPVSMIRVPGTINQDVKALVPRRQVNSQYLLWALRDQANYLLQRVSTAAHGTKKFDLRELEVVQVPDAPAVEQEEFARRVGLLNDIRNAEIKALSRDEALFASLQSRAFKGEL